MRRLAWLLLLVGRTWAATHLVAIGVEQYERSDITPLKCACSDARSFVQVFTDAGLSDSAVRLLTTDAQDLANRPTRSVILNALTTVAGQARDGDRVILFYAGHGVELADHNYLFGYDTNVDLVEDTAVPMALINKALRNIQASELLFIVDACRNDPVSARGDQDAALSAVMARGLRPRPLSSDKSKRKPPLSAALLSCSPGQRSWEDANVGHGVFSASLLQGLRGDAAGPDGLVRLNGLMAYVTKEVKDWAARHNRQQAPTLTADPGAGEMVILRPPAEDIVTARFEAVPLAEAVHQLQSKTSCTILLGSGVDGTRPVTIALGAQPLETTLQAITAGADLQVRREDRIYLIERSVKPSGWPAYLHEFASPPSGESWSSFRLSAADGMPQGRVPGGLFCIGSTPDQAQAGYQLARASLGDKAQEAWFACESPHRYVTVSPYWMDLHEVTYAQFAGFLNQALPDRLTRKSWVALSGETPAGREPSWLLETAGRYQAMAGHELQPVVWVTWYGAAAYAAWAHRSLPTEAQWERAARAGLDLQPWPWGRQPEPPPGVGNLPDASSGLGWAYQSYADGYRASAPVASFERNAFGLYDLAGNVFEWCQDSFDPRYYDTIAPLDPACTQGLGKTIRGGSWGGNSVFLRPAARAGVDPGEWREDLGFRCVSAE